MEKRGAPANKCDAKIGQFVSGLELELLAAQQCHEAWQKRRKIADRIPELGSALEI